MEESNIPDMQKNIHNMNTDKVLLIYNKKLDNLPVGIEYVDIQSINTVNLENFNHIVIFDLLDFYNDKQINEVLIEIFKKIKDGTKLETQGIDLKQLCVAVANDDIDQELAKEIIYNRKTMHNLYEIENYLIELGFKTLGKRYINIFEYNIVVNK